MSDRRFPPHACDWSKDDFGSDYCGLGMALREQLSCRAEDAMEIERLKAALAEYQKGTDLMTTYNMALEEAATAAEDGGTILWDTQSGRVCARAIRALKGRVQ